MIRLRSIRPWLRDRLERSAYRLAQRLSTYQARRMLSRDRPLKILVDNTVRGAARIYSTRWLSFETDPSIPFERSGGMMVPYPTHHAKKHRKIMPHLPFLPGLVYLAETGYVELLTSFEMDQERFHQPAGRYLLRGYFDHNLFGHLDFRSVDDHEVRGFDWQEKPQDRLRRRSEYPFRAIVEEFGEHNNVDAWHLHTLLTHDIDVMLHIDSGIAGYIHKNRYRPPASLLSGRVIMPDELAHRYRMDPIEVTAIPIDV